MSDSSGVEIQYEDLVENLPFIIICYRPDTTIFYANQAAHDYFAMPSGGLLGHRWIQDLPEDRQPENRADLLRYTPDAPVRTIENPVRRGDGAGRRVRWTSRAFFNEAGAITHFQEEGCQTLQGFLFARPQPAADCERMLARHVSSTTNPGFSA